MPEGAPFDPEGGRQLVVIMRAAARAAKKQVLNPAGSNARAKQFNRARAAAQLNDLNRDLRALHAQAASVLDARGLRVYARGLRDAERLMRDAGLSADSGPISATLTGAETTRARVILRPAQADLSKAFNSIGTTAGRAIRRANALGLDNVSLKRVLASGLISGEPTRTGLAVKAMIAKIVNKDGLVEVVDRHGTVITFKPDYYAQLVFDTATAEASNIATLDGLIAKKSFYLQIIGSESKNFCTAFRGKVFYIGPGEDPTGHFPHINSLPRGGAPFHPRCTKRYVPFNMRTATPADIDKAKLNQEEQKLLGKTPEEAEKAYRASKRTEAAAKPPNDVSPAQSAPESVTPPPQVPPETDAAPPLQSVQAMFRLPASGTLAPAFRSTAESVDRVHRLPSTARPVPVQVVPNAFFEGQAKFHRGVPVAVQVRSTAKRPRFTFAHEIGHYVANEAAGTAANPQIHPAFKAWADAVQRSNAFRLIAYNLDRASDPGLRKYLAYLLDPAEMFARSYAQWIAVQAGDLALMDEFLAARSSGRFSEQWTDEDFEEIGNAFGTAMERLGLQP